MLHPVVRILGLIALASAMPFLGLSWQAIILFVLILLNRGAQSFASLWQARWLLLTIFVLYAGFTPGEPLWPQLPGLSREGFLEAARRIVMLIVLIQSVLLLMRSTPLPQLISGLILLLQPLRLLGFDHQRFAHCLGLVISQISEMRQHMAVARKKYPASWADAAADLIVLIESRAASGKVQG